MDKYPHFTIGELCNIEKGETGIASAIPGAYPLVNTSAERKSCNTFQFDTEAVCIPLVSSTGHGKKSLNYIHYQKGKFALGTILAAVIPKEPKKLSAAFLHRYLQFNKDRKIVPLMKGAANVSLAVKDIAKILIPVPPINEQSSFIELFNKLNDSSTMLRNEFSTQSSILTKLRQSILHEAIEGKLTAEWRKYNPVKKGDPDYDAVSLLEKIKVEKQGMIAEGKIKKEKPLAPINPEEVPFELPNGWVWTRLANCSINKDGAREPVSQSQRQSLKKIFPYYGASGIIDKIDGYTHEGQNLLIGEDGANLIARSTPVAFIADDKYWVNNHAHVLGFVSEYLIKYIEIHINAIDLLKYITGGFQPKLSQENLNHISIALPPLSEQQAIVSRVEKLLAMVGELGKQIVGQNKQTEELMQTVLREAFEGGI